MKKNILLFDVEAISLHGGAFAVGAIVADENDEIIDKFSLKSLEGERNVGDWVKQNVLPSLTDMPTCKTNLDLGNKFYNWYLKHMDNCEIWSDVNYPVETNFLSALVSNDPIAREWKMPYPFYDVADFVDVNVDRAQASGIPGLRKHHPMDDAIASFHCLIKSDGFKKFIKGRIDSSVDTLLHIKRVSQLLNEFAMELIRRGNVHDDSKLKSPEKEMFDTATGRLKNSTYGSEEYKGFLKELKPALDHHYANNSHHPEHYENGINGFDLMDLVELFFDWKAAGERHANGNIFDSIQKDTERFKLSPQVVDIFNNTASRLGYKRPEISNTEK